MTDKNDSRAREETGDRVGGSADPSSTDTNSASFQAAGENKDASTGDIVDTGTLTPEQVKAMAAEIAARKIGTPTATSQSDGAADGQPGVAESTAESGAIEGEVLEFGQQRMPDATTDGAEGQTPDLDFAVELDEISVLKQQFAESEAKAADNWERVLRMQADMDNQRKRSQKEVENARKFALEGLANELLPVKDSLEMGLQAAGQDDADMQNIIEGSDLTLKMLSQALEKYKIIEVNPVDEKFNPELHQAMSSQEVEGKEPNTVVAVLQKGYTLNERLIRPALVMVAK